MTTCVLVAFFSSLALVSGYRPRQEQKFEYAKQAELDSAGNIYVSSDEGKLIKMAEAGHCLEVRVANDRQTVACTVSRSGKGEEASQSLRLEIYLKNGRRTLIETESPILDWHFWNEGQQIAVCSAQSQSTETCRLYDASSAHLIQQITPPLDEGLLPEWAKSPGQVQDESVPLSEALSQERTKWIAKVLRQIGKIKPGMKREDLVKVFSAEGGLSNRFQRTYVYRECPYIKVNVRFTAASNQENALGEDPNDIIESISQPYLAWSIVD